jgi:hypothetical protein
VLLNCFPRVSGGVDLRIIAIGIRIGKRQVGPDAGAAIIR